MRTLRRGDRTRTCDSLVPNQERYQLRYTPEELLRQSLLDAHIALVPKSDAKVVIIFHPTKFFVYFFQEKFTGALHR